MLTDSANNDLPTPRRLVVLVMIALVIRAAFFVTAARRSGLSFAQQSRLGDSAGYIHYGQLIAGQPIALSDYERRLFPGSPLAIAGLIRLGIPGELAVVLQSWIGACVAVAASAVLFRSVKIGLAVAIMMPDYLLVTSVVASEGLMMGSMVGGLMFARGRQPVLGGLLLGFASIVRPMACFAALAYVIAELSDKKYRNAIIVGAGCTAVVAATLIVSRWLSGDALQSAHGYMNNAGAYNGQLFDWPLHSIWHYSTLPGVDRLKAVYVWLNLVFVLVAVAILVKRARASDDLSVLSLVWTVANTFFCLCVGSKWGYLCFPAFYYHRRTCHILWLYTSAFLRQSDGRFGLVWRAFHLDSA